MDSLPADPTLPLAPTSRDLVLEALCAMASDEPLSAQLDVLSGDPAVTAALSAWLLALQGRARR